MCGCGCATIHLDVDREHGKPADLCKVPIAADMKENPDDPVEPAATVGLLLFLDAGWLSSLEIWWIDVIPAEFPPPSSFEEPRLLC